MRSAQHDDNGWAALNTAELLIENGGPLVVQELADAREKTAVAVARAELLIEQRSVSEAELERVSGELERLRATLAGREDYRVRPKAQRAGPSAHVHGLKKVSNPRLTTGRPPRCASCRRVVNPEFIDIVLERRMWVFCGRPCRLEWERDHLAEPLSHGNGNNVTRDHKERREGFQNSLTNEGGVLVPESQGSERGDDKVETLQPDGQPVPRARST